MSGLSGQATSGGSDIGMPPQFAPVWRPEGVAGRRVGSFRREAAGQHPASQGVPIVVPSAELENIARLRAGVIDAWVTGEQAARYLAEEADLPLRRLFVFNEVELYLACHPSVPDYFIARLQAALDRKDNTERPL